MRFWDSDLGFENQGPGWFLGMKGWGFTGWSLGLRDSEGLGVKVRGLIGLGHRYLSFGLRRK